MDKLDPTIRYLQKLGPKHVDLIFSEAKWVFQEDAQMASRVSTQRSNCQVTKNAHHRL